MANGLFNRFSGVFQLFNSNVSTLLNRAQVTKPVKLEQPVRFKFADWRMMKDYKKRQCLVQYAPDRLRYTALRKNDILPPEIQEVASREIAALPVNSSISRIRYRCAVTSRPRGVVYRWRLSRIVWRSLADYNKLSGVQRAIW